MNKERFIKLFEESLEKDDNTVKMEDKFRDYEEWDSLAYLSILVSIKEEYNVKIQREIFESFYKVEDIFNYIISQK